MFDKVSRATQFKRILRDFPRNMKFCFAYGSGAFKQQTSDPSSNMLDLIFVVKNPRRWHSENLNLNPSHYAQPLRLLGHKAIANVQETWGAKIYYNTLVKTTEGRYIKYGVVSGASLVEDLLDWNMLYLAGRLHKPVEILVEPDDNSPLKRALLQNLYSAVHTSLLLLPEHFSEHDFFNVITGLSYNGDFRMIFGEDKDKIKNIVLPQLDNFRELYMPILQHFDQYTDITSSSENNSMWCQDMSPATRNFHLNQLPRMPQRKLVKAWSKNRRSIDIEDSLWAIAHNPDCSIILDQSLRDIVWKSSVTQSTKGILTAGIVKSIKYSGTKIAKMIRSQEQKKKKSIVQSSSISLTDKVEKDVTKNDIGSAVKKGATNAKVSEKEAEH